MATNYVEQIPNQTPMGNEINANVKYDLSSHNHVFHPKQVVVWSYLAGLLTLSSVIDSSVDQTTG